MIDGGDYFVFGKKYASDLKNFYRDFAGSLKLFMDLPGDTLCEKAGFYLRDYAKLSEKQLALIYDVLVEKGKVGENL